MPIPGISAAAQGQWVKVVSYPGQGPEHAGNTVDLMVWTTVVSDGWFPQTGMPGDFKFTVPVGGNYAVTLQANFPHYPAAPGGFGHGYSGPGASARMWLQTTRAGTPILTGVGDTGNVPLPEDSSNHVITISNALLTGMQAGDKIEAYASGGATGYGPIQYDAVMTMIKRKA